MTGGFSLGRASRPAESPEPTRSAPILDARRLVESPFPSRAKRFGALLYGFAAYAAFLASFLGFVAFTAGLPPGGGIDDGRRLPAPEALAVDLLLVTLFATHHSVMARPRVKDWFRRLVHPELERSTYVLVSSLLLGLLVVGWRPLPEAVWEIENRAVVAAFAGACAFGWLLVFWATFMIDHFDLFGLRQVLAYAAGRRYRSVPFRVAGAYRFVRHPIMLGMLLGLWATPRMSIGHLVLALTFTVYVAIGIVLEQRTLVRELGEPYRRYLERVPAFLPRLRPRRRGALRRRT